MIEDIPILEEQDSDHSLWVVAVCPGGAGWRGSIKALARLWSPGACELLVIKALVGVADAVNH